VPPVYAKPFRQMTFPMRMPVAEAVQRQNSSI
jgi:hypothetical protein